MSAGASFGQPLHRFGTSGTSIALQGVNPGTYDVRVGAFSEVSGRWEWQYLRTLQSVGCLLVSSLSAASICFCALQAIIEVWRETPMLAKKSQLRKRMFAVRASVSDREHQERSINEQLLTYLKTYSSDSLVLSFYLSERA